MTLRIRNWADNFENNRSRELKNLTWVPLPNGLDEDLYCLIMDQENGSAILGCWHSILFIASKSKPRGELTKSNGDDHSPESLARISRHSAGLVRETLTLMREYRTVEGYDVSPEAVGSYNTDKPGCENPAGKCENPAIEGKGIEGKGIEGNKASKTQKPASTPSQLILSGLADESPEPFTTDKKPSPHDVLEAFDAIFKRETGTEYARATKGKEYNLAKGIITAVSKLEDSRWSQIPEAIEAAFQTKFIQDNPDFSLFASKFGAHNASAQGGGKWNMVQHVLDQQRREA